MTAERVYVSDGSNIPISGIAVVAYRTNYKIAIETKNLGSVSIKTYISPLLLNTYFDLLGLVFYNL